MCSESEFRIGLFEHVQEKRTNEGSQEPAPTLKLMIKEADAKQVYYWIKLL